MGVRRNAASMSEPQAAKIGEMTAKGSLGKEEEGQELSDRRASPARTAATNLTGGLQRSRAADGANQSRPSPPQHKVEGAAARR